MIVTAKKSLPKWPQMKNFMTVATTSSKLQAKPISDCTDEELVVLFQKGREDAFQVLLSKHERPLFNFLVKYLGNREVAEEAFQEVFLRIIKNINEYKPQAKFTTWMYTIARNFCIDFGRKQRFRHHLSLDAPVGQDAEPLMNRISDGGEASEDKAHNKDLETLLYQIIDELSEEQREVFLLRESQGLQFDEIAHVTGVSTNTVKSRMRYALQAIQKKFSEHGIHREAFQKSASSF